MVISCPRCEKAIAVMKTETKVQHKTVSSIIADADEQIDNLVIAALKATGGDHIIACKILGVGKNYIRRRAHRYSDLIAKDIPNGKGRHKVLQSWEVRLGISSSVGAAGSMRKGSLPGEGAVDHDERCGNLHAVGRRHRLAVR